MASNTRSRPTARALAAQVIGRVTREDAYVQPALSAALERTKLPAPSDRGFVTELVYGTLRHLARIDAAIETAASRRLKKIDDVIADTARVATYEALILGSADHALVNEAVNNAKALRGENAGRFLNGVLRGLLRQRDSGALLPAQTPGVDGLVARSGLPKWLAQDVFGRLGAEKAEAFGAASLERPSLHLSVPKGAAVRASVLADLAAKGIEAHAHPWVETGIVLKAASGAIDALLMGEDPRALVQNAASQMVASWACDAATTSGPGTWVLDLCAAPGGKSSMLAAHGFNVVSGDVHVDKLHQARPQWDRLGVSPHAVGLDAAHPPFAPNSFWTVVLDAPCTGSGLLARRPEIKLRRAGEDVTRLAVLQAALLEAAAPLVKKGGHLLYSVCSVSSEEGPKQVKAFLAKHPEYAAVPYAKPLPDGCVKDGMLTLWPHLGDVDGFFAALLVKQA